MIRRCPRGVLGSAFRGGGGMRAGCSSLGLARLHARETSTRRDGRRDDPRRRHARSVRAQSFRSNPWVGMSGSPLGFCPCRCDGMETSSRRHDDPRGASMEMEGSRETMTSFVGTRPGNAPPERKRSAPREGAGGDQRGRSHSGRGSSRARRGLRWAGSLPRARPSSSGSKRRQVPIWCSPMGEYY